MRLARTSPTVSAFRDPPARSHAPEHDRAGATTDREAAQRSESSAIAPVPKTARTRSLPASFFGPDSSSFMNRRLCCLQLCLGFKIRPALQPNMDTTLRQGHQGTAHGEVPLPGNAAHLRRKWCRDGYALSDGFPARRFNYGWARFHYCTSVVQSSSSLPSAADSILLAPQCALSPANERGHLRMSVCR